MMKKVIKRMTAVTLACSLLLMTGCTKDGDKKGNEEESAGRYVETEYQLPEEVAMPMALKKLADGTLRLVDMDKVYDSKDNGKTWELAYQIDDQSEGENYPMTAAIDESGRVFQMLMGEQSGSEKAQLFDAQGKASEIELKLPELAEFSAGDQVGEIVADSGASVTSGSEIEMTAVPAMENALTQSWFFGERFFGCDFQGIVHQIDLETGEVLNSYGEGRSDYIDQCAIVGEKLVTLSMEGVTVYDLNSGKVVEDESGLQEYFTGNVLEERDNGALSALSAGEEALYYTDQSGLYRYVFGAGKMEQMINGNIAKMGTPDYSLVDMVELEDHQFLMLYFYQGESSLMHYEYSKDVSAAPSKELSAYALKDNKDIRRMIAAFQAANPDYIIDLKVGISEEDSITVSDALETLNTDIMAGKGPDLIFMEGLPIESYSEKGILANLSDVAKAVTKEHQAYENILYSLGDQKEVYALPTRVALPVLAGETDDLEGITDNDSLAKAVEQLRSANGEKASIIGSHTAEELLKALMTTELPTALKKDGTLDQSAIEELLKKAKVIADNNDLTKAEMDQIQMAGVSQTTISKYMLPILMKDQQLYVGQLNGLTDLAMMNGMFEKVNWEHKLLGGEKDQVFIPLGIVGVNAKSDKVEESKEFIKYLFTEELQGNGQIGGLPLTEEGIDREAKTMSETNEGDEMALMMEKADGTMADITFKYVNPSEAQLQELKDQLKGAQSAYVNNEIIIQTIVDAGSKYLNGEEQLEDAAETILKTMNLYLAE